MKAFRSCLPILALALLSAAALADPPARAIAFKIDSQPVDHALKAFAGQSGLQVLFHVEGVSIPPELKSPAIDGTFTPEAALAQILANTGLRYEFINPRTVTIRSARDASPSNPTSQEGGPDSARGKPRLARLDTDPSQDMQKVAAGMEQKNEKAADKKSTAGKDAEGREVVVTGSRIRQDARTAGPEPVLVYTRKDIERSGAVSIADFTNRLTQNASEYSGMNSRTVTGPLGARSTVNLRGLGNATTLVLVDGHRLPRSGQGFDEDDYDIAGIPLAAVERIEVLTEGASAIYGADAIGGVMNIITRKGFRGTEASLQYGNVFDGNVGEASASFTTGFSGNKYSAFISASVSHRDSMSNLARPYSATYDFSSSGGRDDRYGAYGGAGQILSDDFGGTPLPGLETGTVGIPPNQDGRNLTIADFLPYQDVVEPLDAAPYGDLVFESRLQSIRASFQYEVSDRLGFYFDGGYSVDRNYQHDAPPMATLLVPAGNPFNPFGVDVFVEKTFYELGRALTMYGSRNVSFTGGARGDLAGSWRYDSAFSYAKQVSFNSAPHPASIGSVTADPLLALTSPSTALNVFGDGRTTTPNNPGVLESALGVSDYNAPTENSTLEAKADGRLFTLPSGEVRLAAGAEYRNEKVEFNEFNTTDLSFLQLSKGAKREVFSAYSELQVPLVDRERHLPFLSMLDVQLAGRMDRYENFGEQFSPKASLRWKPFPSLMFRASIGNGFKTPTLYQLEQPVVTRNGRVTPGRPPTDRPRNERLTRTVRISSGGNVDLRPEQSDTQGFGFVFQPTFLQGLTFSADYYHIDFQDRVVFFVNSQDILDFFPDRIVRGPPTPEDIAAGRPGPIIAVDLRAVNLARSETKGIDFRLDYNLDSAYGHWQLSAEATRIMAFEDQAAPSSPRLERADTLAYPTLRMNTSVFWNQGEYEVGVLNHYVADSGKSPGSFAPPLPARIASASEFDLQVSRDFQQARGWLEGVKLTAGIRNIFDVEPPATNGDGGYARIDPRQRRFELTLRKNF